MVNETIEDKIGPKAEDFLGKGRNGSWEAFDLLWLFI